MKLAIRLATAVLAFAHFCPAQEITVAAAADLQFVMPEIVKNFQKQTGKAVKVIYGSSGNFFQQIQNGAPFDIFFSANLDYPRNLQAAGLAEADSIYSYARGTIVLWVPKASTIDLARGLLALRDQSVKKIAIANPQHAPYGQAAVLAMQKTGVYDAVKDKLVMGENISQAASFVTTGAADVGVLALSLAVAPSMRDKGHYTEIPQDEYPPIEQACVILRTSKNKAVARQLLAYIRTQTVARILHQYGFDVSQR